MKFDDEYIASLKVVPSPDYGGSVKGIGIDDKSIAEHMAWATANREWALTAKCSRKDCPNPVDWNYEPAEGAGDKRWGICRQCAEAEGECSCGSTPCCEFHPVESWKKDGKCRECGAPYNEELGTASCEDTCWFYWKRVEELPEVEEEA